MPRHTSSFYERIFFDEAHLENAPGDHPPPLPHPIVLALLAKDINLTAWASFNKICVWEHLGREHP